MKTNNSCNKLSFINQLLPTYNVLNMLYPLLSIILFTLGSSFFTTFMNVRLDQAGVTQFEIGWIQSCFYIGMLLGGVALLPIIYKLGFSYSYSLFTGIAVLSLLLQSIITVPWFWMILRLMFGISIAGIYIIIESCLLANSPENARARTLTLYMTILYASQTISHEFLYFTGFITTIPFTLSSFLCLISLLPMLLLNLKINKNEISQQNNFKKTYFYSPFGFIGCFVSGIIMSVLLSFTPNFAYSYNYSIPLIMQITLMGACLLQYPLGLLSDYMRRDVVLLVSCIITSMAAATILIFYKIVLVVYVISFILGGCSFTLYTLSIATVCNKLHKMEIISANSTLMFAYGLGAIIGPIMASLCMDLISVRSLYGYIAIIAAILSWIGLCSNKNKES